MENLQHSSSLGNATPSGGKMTTPTPTRISLRRSITGTILTTTSPNATPPGGKAPVLSPKIPESNGMRIHPHILELEKYRAIQSLQPGKLIWGILAKYPYWPCMVCADPSGLFLRQAEGKIVSLRIHVRFFGPKGLRSWITPGNFINFDPNDIPDSLRNGNMGRKMASDKILAELNWAIEDATLVAAEESLENRAALFQKIIEEQFSRWKEDRKLSSKFVPNKEASVKRRRSSLVSLDGVDQKRIKISAEAYETDMSPHSFRSVSSSSGVSTMSKSSIDALSVSSSGLGDLEEDEALLKPPKTAYRSPEMLEEEVSRILKSIPIDLAEIKKSAQATLCRNCTRDSTMGALVQCTGVCGGIYHEHCLDMVSISFDRLLISSGHNSASGGRKKKKGKKSTVNLTVGPVISGTVRDDPASPKPPIIAHVTGDMTVMTNPIICKACRTGELPNCFICHEPTNCRRNFVAGRDIDRDVTCCSVPNCGRAYHLECLNQWPQAKKRREGFICPQHQCHLCISEDPRSQNFKMKQKLFRCLLCPTAYHMKENCMPAGTEIVGTEAIICQRHFTVADAETPTTLRRAKQDEEKVQIGGAIGKEAKYKRKPLHFALNVNWCFICARGGNLVCCDQCPSAFHRECLKLAPITSDTEEANAGKFICEECELGRFPLYGELVWAKYSNYRWWPGVIVSDGQVPARLNSNRRNRGEFCIKFLGSNDYGWISRRRVFLYHDDDSLLTLDDKSHKAKITSPVKGKPKDTPYEKEDGGQLGHQLMDSGAGVRSGSYESSFRRSLVEARVVNTMLQKRKELRGMELSKCMRPLPYFKLKVNRVVAPVKLNDFRAEDMEDTICNCRAAEDESVACGANSECLNRLLLTECNPARCPAGALCDNQQLQRRQYPPLDIIRTTGKGWGLISKDDLKAGVLVCEYVGELINNAEMRRRIKEKEAEKDDVYYFLILNNNLIIDAERKGNLARFMNHSCEPNCESQKWTVNGNTRVGLFAKTDIQANTELTFNYNWESTGTNRTKCQCGAKKCKGFIGSGTKRPI